MLLVLQLCRDCDVLLLDEPAGGLDPQTRIELYQLLRREANNRQLTALVATHVINDIERVADDVCILDNGRILLYAGIEDLREQVWVIDCEAAAGQAAVETLLPEDVQLLHKSESQVLQLWLRDPDQRIGEQLFAGEIRRRRATLEELFLAVTSRAESC